MTSITSRMKKITRFFIYLLGTIGIIALGLKLTGNGYLLKGVWATYLHGHNTASIDDMRFFETGRVKANNPLSWEEDSLMGKVELSKKLRESLESSESVAFLAVKRGKLIFEEYWDGYSDSSYSNSFSMAKSITTLLTQRAIQQGYINSWDDKVIKYLPNLKGPYASQITLRHLATMTANLTWKEKYKSPFAITAKTYFGEDVQNLLYSEVTVDSVPGEIYTYQSGATEYLGMAVQAAVKKPIYEFASEALWSPIGAENDAYWHLDDHGMALTFCCFNSNARDFAKLGGLMINYGKLDGVQIIDSAFVAEAQRPYKSPYYGCGFWIDHEGGEGVYYFRGVLGQYIIIFPERDLVVVRLGKKRVFDPNSPHPSDFRKIVEEIKNNNW